VLGGALEEGGPCLGQDEARAAELFARAAAKGEEVAMVRLGLLYYEGRGVPKDIAAARRWFRAAVLSVAALDPGKRERLLRLALTGADMPKLLEQQMAWLRLIEWGGPESVLDLAKRMRSGDGVPQNEEAAEHLMGGLAADDFPPALYELGRWLLERAGDGEDRRRAFRRILRAAWDRYLPAMLDLAHRMLEGRGVERDNYRAYIAFLEARDMGADVDDELALLEARLGYFEIRAAREPARRSDRFPAVVFRSQWMSNRAGSVPRRAHRFRS
ncbi:MAG: hypothetical protein ACREH3_11775, partial [Geminicoccales bacterium]